MIEEGRRLTHIDEQGRAAMVDVSGKPVTSRRAVAESYISLQPATLAMVAEGSMPKGPVLATAELAGTQAAKRTAELIPLCHPLQLTNIAVRCTAVSDGIRIRATVECSGQTGVEMEALVAASVASLTIYDMVKAVDRSAVIGPTRLIEKTGGASGTWQVADVESPR
ncbi:MAG: cyclic pyranopterin monophosphate synthase accessory protein [Chloroflexota bacterium]|jgi:cyclic pyranopterin phosphate synthase